MTNEEFKKLVFDTGLTYSELEKKTGYKAGTLEAICNGRRKVFQRHIDAIKAIK